MTLQELAEREFPDYSDYVEIVECERTAFLKGLQTGMEFAEWVSENEDYSYSRGNWYYQDWRSEITTKELFEIFIKEKQ